jgi:salicylate hydroxylase
MDGRSQEKKKLKVGIVGAGLGGMMAAIAIAEAGAEVTILEAASELGELCRVA